MPNIYGNSQIWGDLLVTGSFSILGSASTINSTNLIISDAIISLGHSQSGSPVIDEGIMFGRGTGLTQAIIWDETNDTFALIGTNDDHTVIGSININSYSNLRVGGLTATSLRLTTGASTGYILQSDASGNASWVLFSSGLTGSGVSNYVPFWTNSNTLSSTSSLFQNGQNIGIGTNTPVSTLDVRGSVTFNNSNGDNDFLVKGTFDNALLQTEALSDTVGVGGYSSNTKLSVSTTKPSQLTSLTVNQGNGTSSGINYGIYLTSNTTNTLINHGIYIDTTSATTNYGVVVNRGTSVFNEGGDANTDFRIEGDTNTNLFFVDASSDSIGMGTNTPIHRLEVSGTISTTGFRMTNGASNGYFLISDSSGYASWTSSVASSNFANTDLTFTGNRIHDTNGNYLVISTDSGAAQQSWMVMDPTYANFGFQNSIIEAEAATFSIRSGGAIIIQGRITETVINPDNIKNFRVDGYTESNLIFARVDNDCVGIGTNTPTYRLQVSGTVSTTGFRMTNGSSNGYVLTSDSSGNATWQPAGVSGSGTSNYLAKWSSSSALTDSLIFDNGSVVGINGWSSQHTLGVYSNVEINAILAANSNTTLTSKRGIITSVTGGGSSSFNTGLEISVQDAVNTNYGIIVNTSGSGGLHNYAAAFVNNSTAPTNYGLYIDSYSASIVNYGVVVHRGTSVFNESGADYDFRIEGMTQSNLFFVDASNDNIGIGTNAPNSKAILDVSSTTKGFLPPRMTTVQREAITSPPAGLMIFNTTNSRHEGYTGTTWSGFY